MLTMTMTMAMMMLTTTDGDGDNDGGDENGDRDYDDDGSAVVVLDLWLLAGFFSKRRNFHPMGQERHALQNNGGVSLPDAE